MARETWVVGATGRTGRAIAGLLAATGTPLVLVGRDRQRLDEVAAPLDGARVVVGALDHVLAELPHRPPAVVVNTVGPFTATAVRVATACPPGTHYVDIGNELPAARAVLDLHDAAEAAGQTFVVGAGFGVVASECALLHALGSPPAPSERPSSVRVDAVPSLAIEAGRFGTALAATIIGGLPAGGSQVRRGGLAPSRLGAHPLRLTTPDGDAVVTAGAPSADLLAAWRTSGADTVFSANSETPTGVLARLGLPVAAALARVPPLARVATGRLARVELRARPRPRRHSWARATVTWPGGRSRESWLRADDAGDFTAAAAAAIAARLAAGDARTGAHTPGALFGPGIAEAAGGVLLSTQGTGTSA